MKSDFIQIEITFINTFAQSIFILYTGIYARRSHPDVDPAMLHADNFL